MNFEGQRYAIIGAGDLAVEVICYLLETHDPSSLNCTIWDDYENSQLIRDSRCKYGGKLQEITVKADEKALICLGDCNRRREITSFLKVRGIDLGNFIHPSSVVSSFAKVSNGNIILPYSCISAEAIIGENTLINSHVAIGHHAKIGENCVISPQVLIAGRVEVGRETFIGAGAIITQGKNIGEKSKVSAGSVIYRNASERAFLFGNPAKNFSKG